MRKLVPALTLLAAAALGLTGCDVHLGPYAAVVDGVTISQSTLDSGVSSAASDKGYICGITSAYAAPIATHGVGTGTYDTRFEDFVLTWFVRAQLAADEVSAKHLTVDPAILQSVAAGEFASELTTSSSTGQSNGCSTSPTGADILAGLSSGYRDALITFYEDLDVLASAQDGVTLTAAGLNAFATANPAEASLTCLDYIEVPTQAAAEAAEKDLAGGASFTTAAAKVSGSSSTVPCTSMLEFPAALAQPIEALSIGQDSAPVADSSEYLIFQVTNRQTATTLELANAVVLGSQAHFSTIFTQLDKSSSVQVDPAYGSWTLSLAGTSDPITPPTGPPNKYVPAVGAVTAPDITPPPTTTLPAGQG